MEKIIKQQIIEIFDSMKVLAVDVGMGTQDILLFDSSQSMENSIKMVLPSQTQIIAGRIKKATTSRRNIVLTGTTMGGGPSGSAVRKHIQAGLKVFATRKAALTLHDNLEKVTQMGVEIIDEEKIDFLDAVPIIMSDIDTDALGGALGLFETQMPGDFAVAVQDHGEAPDMSNRIFRFRYFIRLLEKGGELERFAYLNKVPDSLTRMRSVLETLKTDHNNVLVMDT
ncbi:MAG: pyruvate formate lyase-activating protein, partial [ANME-2 cluster archaeon]